MTPMRFSTLAAPLGALLLLAGCGSEETKKEEGGSVQAVEVTQIKPSKLVGGKTVSGRLQPRDEIAIGADLDGYRVMRILVDEGDFVRRGQPVAILDGSLLNAQIAQARGNLVEQEAIYEKAKLQSNRVKGLENQGVLAEEEIEGRRLNARIGQGRVAAARGELNNLLARGSHLVIRAPADGIILERAVRLGDTSSSSNVMYRMARAGLVELHAELPERDVRDISVGDPVEVTAASGQKVEGTVRLVGARVNDKTGLVVVRMSLPAMASLRQGGFARARLLRERADVLAVQESAIQYDSDGAFVQTVDGKDQIRRVRVKTGGRAGGLVEIVEGPPSGTRVVVQGGAFTLDGDKVRIVGGGRK